MSMEVALNLREEEFTSQMTLNGTLHADGCCLSYLPNLQGRQACCPFVPLGVLPVSHIS